MTSELLSGPDLGGGYLHQLSLDRDGERTSVTYHAQDGGADANGPPKGPLDAFGFVHPPVPCMFGGPRCWHRRFLLPFVAIPRARQAYNRNRFVLETMLDQEYDHAAVPVDAALDELIARVADLLARDRIEWYVGGSTAARLLGARVAPRDIDLGTTRAGVDRLGNLLGEFLIEPVAPTDWPSSGIVHAGRAFVGTLRDGVRVEWAVPIEPRDPIPFDEWSGRPDTVRTVGVTFHGRSLRVSRPEYALVRAHEKRRTADAESIAEVVRQFGPDGVLLDALLVRSTLPEPRRQEVRRQTLGSRLG